jgi:hypothetical protein
LLQSRLLPLLLLLLLLLLHSMLRRCVTAATAAAAAATTAAAEGSCLQRPHWFNLPHAVIIRESKARCWTSACQQQLVNCPW